jgi:hypothetical protein
MERSGEMHSDGKAVKLTAWHSHPPCKSLLVRTGDRSASTLALALSSCASMGELIRQV